MEGHDPDLGCSEKVKCVLCFDGNANLKSNEIAKFKV